jgi:hypothetical protein
MFDTMDDGTNRAMFNQITYNYPTVAPVFSALTLGSNATEESAYGPLAFVVDHMQSFELLVKNGDAGKHPLFDLSSVLPFLADPLAAICTATSFRSSSASPTTRPMTRAKILRWSRGR